MSVGVGVIGLGFMGRTHVAAYQAAARDGWPCRLVAVADQDERRRRGEGEAGGNLSTGAAERLFDPDEVRGHATAEALLADLGVDLVSVCTHTDTHVAIAEAALRAGKHVVVEKPVAISANAVEHLARVAAATGRVCMPAMCMRFWPAWAWLKECVDEARMGVLRAVRFERLGAAPGWSADFYANAARSGGAMFDLHVHDADFVVHLLGVPRAVEARGHEGHLTASYRFDGPTRLVSAQGGWLPSASFPFRMRYLAEFERGVADFDIAREPQLLVHDQTGTHAPEVGTLSGYDGELRHAVDLVAGRESRPRATIDEAVAVTRLLEAERESLRSGRVVPLG